MGSGVSLGDFQILCFASALLVSVALLTLYVIKRSMLIKPSMFLILVTNVMFQWPLALQAKEYYGYLIQPLTPLVITFCYCCCTFIVSSLTWNTTSKEIWCSLGKDRDIKFVNIVPLITLLFLIFAYYLTKFPLQSTGLYALLFNPKGYTAAREASYKLLSDGVLIYLIAIAINALSPVIGAFLGLAISRAFKKRRYQFVIGYTLVFMAVMVAVTLPGTRGPSATMIIAAFLACSLKRRFRIGPAFIATLVIFMLTPALLMTVMREGKLDDFLNINNNASEVVAQGVLQRTFSTPLKTGVWHIDHVQRTEDYFGITGIPKLAKVYGESGINSANVIGKLYAPDAIETSHANTGYIFCYFSYFGYWSIPICVVGALFLDYAMLLYLVIGNDLMIPAIAGSLIATSKFTITNYTTAILSGGFIPIVLICYFICKFFLEKKTLMPIGRLQL